MELLPDRALWWPEQQALFVADLHLGKESTFRQNGLAVPKGSTQKCLKRLSSLIQRVSAKKLIILGDLFHARSSLATDVMEHFSVFRQSHPSIEFSLVEGNHDIHTGRLPDSWNMAVATPPVTIASVMLTHYPQPPAPTMSLCLSGHLHPALRLGGEFAAEGRMPCFVLTNQACLVLPAFGEFVGSSLVDYGSAERIWLTAADKTIEIPPTLLHPSK